MGLSMAACTHGDTVSTSTVDKLKLKNNGGFTVGHCLKGRVVLHTMYTISVFCITAHILFHYISMEILLYF